MRTARASSLACCLEADEVKFLVGETINPAHQSPELPADLGLKHHVAAEIAAPP